MLRLLFSFWLTAVSAAGATPSLRVYYTANRQGEVEPCGCAVNQIGGLNRWKKLLDAETKTSGARPSFTGDAGDTFFAFEQLNPHRRAQDLLRARLIAESYRKLGVDAIAPGEKDFAAGIETLRDLEKASGAALVSANLLAADGKLLFPPYRIVKRREAKVAFVGIADEKAFEHVDSVKVRPASDALTSAVVAARAEGADLVVLLSHSGLARDKELAKIAGIDLIIGSHSSDVLADPLVVGATWVVQPLPQGENIGWVDFPLTPFSHKLVDLGKELDGPNEITTMMEKHKKAVRELALKESAEAQVVKAEKPFVAHPQHCRTCHQKQHDFWKTTKHASAYLVLYAKNQHFDPECVGCHTLGFESPAGFTRAAVPIVLDKPAKKKPPFAEELMAKIFKADPKKGQPLDSREDAKRYEALKARYHAEIDKLEEAGKIRKLFLGVQCEHCHGNRDGHPSPSVPTVKRVSEATCKECHKPPHDNGFDFEARVKKVACPLSSGS